MTLLVQLELSDRPDERVGFDAESHGRRTGAQAGQLLETTQTMCDTR